MITETHIKAIKEEAKQFKKRSKRFRDLAKVEYYFGNIPKSEQLLQKADALENIQHMLEARARKFKMMEKYT